MARNTYKIKTWKCQDCNYKQDFKSKICPASGGKLILEIIKKNRISVVVEDKADIDLRPLSDAKKTKYKAKIDADNIKFKALE